MSDVCYCEMCEPPRCPACGDYIDYCQGHGEIGDPEGRLTLNLHDIGNHLRCNPKACERVGSVKYE